MARVKRGIEEIYNYHSSNYLSCLPMRESQADSDDIPSSFQGLFLTSNHLEQPTTHDHQRIQAFLSSSL